VALVDFNERQLTLKLVYYGPPLSGKTTNLRWIHGQVDELNRGRLMTLDTRDDRTLFFDLLPIFFKTSNLSFRVKVYTVPGQPVHQATRRVVLQGADGVVFVADSQRSQIRANNESYQNLVENMQALGLEPGKVPIVVQYNKRDLADIVPGPELERLGTGAGERIHKASALTGEGVIETFVGLLEHTWTALDRELHIERSFGIGRQAFLDAMRRHVSSLRTGSDLAENG
jgi:mutual gliding-motility protein MglA